MNQTTTISISTINWPLQAINNFCAFYNLEYNCKEETIELINIEYSTPLLPIGELRLENKSYTPKGLLLKDSPIGFHTHTPSCDSAVGMSPCSSKQEAHTEGERDMASGNRQPRTNLDSEQGHLPYFEKEEYRR